MKKRIIVLAMLVLCLAACSNRKNTTVVSPASEFQVADSLAVSPKYAKGFSVSYLSENVTLLDIQDPEGVEVNSFHYALVQKGSKVDIPQGYTRLETPVGKVICMTSLQLSNFIHLGLTDLVVGVTSTRHLFNETVNRQIKEKKTHKIGIEGNFDTEVIIAI
ncbi:MAG: iron ABC transporter substrate-binding protein, partial [Bacteroidales bacterium]|nr:iron ABC transporter substrate-binding protein [Bacteroidales bacterium]